MSEHLIHGDTMTAVANQARRLSNTADELNAAEIAEIFSRVQGTVQTDIEYSVETDGADNGDFFIQDDTVTAWADHARRISGTTETLNVAEIAEIFSRVQGDIKTNGKYLIEANGFGTDVIKSGTYDTGEIFAFPEPPENVLVQTQSGWIEAAEFDGWTATEPIGSHFMTVENNHAKIAALTKPIDDMLMIVVDIPTSNFQFELYLGSYGGKSIDWGDGTSDYYQGDAVHTYVNSGKYVVKISEPDEGSSGIFKCTPFKYYESTNSSIVGAFIPKWAKCLHGVFNNLTSLQYICIENGITAQSNNPADFNGCSSLRHITLPPSYCTLYALKEDLFNGCEKLESATLSYGITAIPNRCFNGCVSLTDITIPNSVTYIGKHAFSNCPSLKNVNIPDSVYTLDDYVFGGSGENSNYNIETLILPNVAQIGRRAFNNLYGLKTLVLLSYGVPALTIMNDADYSNLMCHNGVTVYVQDISFRDYETDQHWSRLLANSYVNIKPLSEYTGEV